LETQRARSAIHAETMTTKAAGDWASTLQTRLYIPHSHILMKPFLLHVIK